MVIDAVTDVGAAGVVHAWHVVVVLQTPESHGFAVGVMQDPVMQVDWAVSEPAEHEGPAPQAMPLFLLLALQTEVPVEQSTAPV
jgi:hypothetical protein